jgi:predicted lipid-binding transport protein (Tim44 family)
VGRRLSLGDRIVRIVAGALAALDGAVAAAADSGLPPDGGASHGGTLFNGMHDIASALGLDSIARSLGFGAQVSVALLLTLVIAVMVLPTAVVLGRRRVAAPTAPAPRAPGAPPRGAPAGAAGRGTGSQRLHVEGSASRQTSFGQLGVPAGFDTPAFLTNAKLYFGRLQQAWGRGDLNALEQFTSPALFTALTHELRARRDTGPRSTHVVSLDAQLLGIESSEREHIASVHFSGTLSVDGNNESIDEVWNLTRATSGQGGWVLAGIQQLT